jgi:hypothetical protein
MTTVTPCTACDVLFNTGCTLLNYGAVVLAESFEMTVRFSTLSTSKV